MRKLAFIPVAVLCIGAAPPQPDAARPAAPSAADATASATLRTERMSGEIVLTPPAHCLFETAPRQTQGQTLMPRRLDQLPQGNLSLTVMRNVNGCPESTTIREGYGAPGFQAGRARGR
jgi:hypothetical protein